MEEDRIAFSWEKEGILIWQHRLLASDWNLEKEEEKEAEASFNTKFDDVSKK